MIKRLITYLLVFLAVALNGNAQNCSLPNKAFQFGENIEYTIYYHLAGIWVGAGEVYFKVDSSRIGKKDFYHFDSYGETFKKYDWIYKVRDHYEAYTSVKEFESFRFKRKVNEGDTYIREDYLFNQKENSVYTLRQMGEDEAMKKDTVDLPKCSFDVLSMIYLARNIDYSNYKIGDKIPIRIFIDNESHDTYIRYLGVEELKVKELGKYRCIKFSPMLIEGTIFNAGEDMTVWVTDDKNRVPLLIETPILVGSIRARVNTMRGLRHPIQSKLD
tara:strand:- start:645 stop:1463 length:819 start_codon:yes stop_codon:yes gene_type:complete